MQSFDLKRFRTDNNLTQSELAELFSCGQNFISRIERGIRQIPPDKLDILQSKFGNISKYYTDKIDPISVPEATPQEVMHVGADVFSRQIVKMMNDKLIAPYSLLEEKEKEIERLNRKIGRLEALLDERKKTDAHQESNADHADAV
ncbi:transcriptional regulator with XRE-family HTH domain [Dysgonomonas sp. PFB1-18]|uniref:helix-turn-helix domain-containing protein n=1 Tax=unclassified Dysgonomonas TaxID=2630389 RepID=UPI0024737A15|nr:MULTISPECIES: helix-turn-helix transcriptional regulator [unclassified Dysgonomonas]MDH6307982.1 transcriptional regulator with XRE-family HTH domain [Dysgonomonas sp. PF1-14]MDH6339521.1 transcriptional regulator with XRE-family HTH domain [Dysgonomonas sp. PF1-16]MDH6381172.1 transcriptional regulator with XRE-family HTH domain [Dysgonomonas sp. PFB1-18]MDH6398384.1 transcriptional regulator with XRE-family HTH domain [Dysgonomonas sp. PF1-23]